MSRLNKKILREIKLNKMQFFNIFIMVFLGVFVFAGVHAYMDGMKISGDKYYESNNLQDIWLSGENFTDEDLKNVKEISNVKNAERILNIRTELENYKDVSLDTNFIETNEISKMYIVDGEEFSKDKKGVWLDSYLAKNLDLKVGDEITFKYKDYEMKEKILGLVTVPDHIYSVKDESTIFPTHKDFGFIYLSVNEFPIQDYMIYNQIIVDVDDTDKIDETKRNIENNIKSAIAVTDRNASSSYQSYNSEIEEGETYSKVFTFLFLFIAILSVVTTMNRFVKKQRTQIGTLKALGFKNRKIIKHYVSYGFYVSLLASILGLILGKYVLGAFFLNMEAQYFEIPVYNTVLISSVYILALIVVVLITIVTYLSCRGILKESAVDALRTEIPKVKNTKFDLTTKGIFKKSSISTRWNLRDIGRNKSRSIMAVVGIIGCTMLLVCAFGMLDTMNSYLDWEFNKISNFEYKLSLSNNYTNEQLEKLTDKYGNSTSETLGIEIKNGDKKEANTLVVNDAKDYLKYTNHNREYMDLKDDGIYITEKLSEKYNLNIGDTISWHIFGDNTWYTCKIVGLNRDPQNQNLNMTRKYYETLGLTYRADSLYTDENLSETKSLDGVDIIQSKANLQEGMESMLDTMKTMITILIVVSAILGFVIIYNLGILSFTEKQYQFATLKVLGFKNQQIKKIFIKQNLWLSIIGIVLGLPLGFIMVDYIFKSALGENYDFSASIKPLSYLLAAGGSLIVAIFVNKVLSRKVKTIDMVTSLKGNE
ncbi:ABC transporter permease [bacterium]|nr:ABC transporter permease [bacterium]